MANNITPMGAATGSQGKGGKKSTAPSRSNGKRQASVQPTPILRTGKSEALTNMFQLMKGSPMQTSKQGVPYNVLVGDQNADPGYLRPPTRQDIDYGDRLRKAMEQEKTGIYPMGINPILAEQRITAAERGGGSKWREDITDPLRREQYGPSTLQNMGDALKGIYSKSLGNMVPFAFLPGGGIWKSQWKNRPNEALPMRQAKIMRGRGTFVDRIKGSRGLEAEYRHKYYGAPEPGPRKSNIYDELGMPQPSGSVSLQDFEDRGGIPIYLGEMGARAEEDLGPHKVSPPGSDLGLPAGALITKGITTPYLTEETRNLIKSGFPVENLPPKVQRFIKNTMKKPKTFFDLSGGRGAGGKGEERGEKKETFNILKILLGLLGLPLKLLGLGGGFGEKETKSGSQSQSRPQQPKGMPWQTENRMNQPSYTARQKSITK